MTEAEWLTCEAPRLLLDHLHLHKWRSRGTARVRKYRLFSCSCVRRVWEDLKEQDRQAVEWSERYADGVANLATMPVDWAALHTAVRYAVYCDPLMASHDVANVAYFRAARQEADRSAAYHAERWQHAMLLREIFGNPFRPPAVVADWFTPLARRLAVTCYEERELPGGHLDNARLAVLSDVLEEAGCTEAAILEHLRSSGPHVRGCWVLDLMLGKS